MKIPEFIEMLFLNNRWALFHAFGGMLIAKALYWCDVPSEKIITVVAVMAITWELLELYAMAEDNGLGIFHSIDVSVLKIYGSWYGWFMDSLGDIIAALIAATFIIL